MGSLFFFQAYDKVFRVTLSKVCDEVSRGTSEKSIPEWFARLSVFSTSYLELIGGLMLMLGLFTTPVLVIFGVHMLLVMIAFGYLQGVWDTRHVFPRFALLILLLLLPKEWNQWAIDALLP